MTQTAIETMFDARNHTAHARYACSARLRHRFGRESPAHRGLVDSFAVGRIDEARRGPADHRSGRRNTGRGSLP